MAKKIEGKKEEDGLIEMELNGSVIRVHPDQVPSHENAGWKVVE